ncbi:hypothetical protein, partial [Shigella boydii]|uniref:hypothetical protein n=1 Tax=Shigella boydii TaxID=621 RepID=UPI002546567A
SGKNIIRWLLKKRTNGSVRYCQYTSLSSPSPEGLFILILSDVSKLLMDFVVLVHKDIFAECNGY